MFLSKPRHGTAVVVEPVRLLVVEQPAFEAFLAVVRDIATRDAHIPVHSVLVLRTPLTLGCD